MDEDELIKRLYVLIELWKNTEKLTTNEVWGECATDLENLLEEHAEQM